jgi:transcriptional regulator with XRE-family HTH domain
MTGRELKKLREAMRMSVVSLGRELGYQGSPNSVRVTIRRYETDRQVVPDYIAARVRALAAERGVQP